MLLMHITNLYKVNTYMKKMNNTNISISGVLTTALVKATLLFAYQ